MRPIPDAFIDAEVAEGTNVNSTQGSADYDDLCQTDASGTLQHRHEDHHVGKRRRPDLLLGRTAAEPKNPVSGQDKKFAAPGNPTDGGGCGSGRIRRRAREQRFRRHRVPRFDVPRAEGLDVQPENSIVSGATRFSLRGTVYDQFGQPLKGNIALQAKCFAGSVLAGNADNSRSARSEPDVPDQRQRHLHDFYRVAERSRTEPGLCVDPTPSSRRA